MDIISNIIGLALDNNDDPVQAVYDYYELKSNPISYRRAREFVKPYIRCRFCGDVFLGDDPDITIDAVYDKDFLITCEKRDCEEMGFAVTSFPVKGIDI